MNTSSDSKKPLLPEHVQLPTSPSSSSDNTFATPPSFEQSQASIHALLERIPNDDDEAVVQSLKGDEAEALLPPDFSEYQAEYSTNAGNIKSHDKHLNEDGEALYRFLLSKASIRPTLYLRCNASHEEWHTRQITRYVDGRSVTSTETYSEKVTDFDFTIDISDAILPAPRTGAPIWLAGDKNATYRGGRQLEVDSAPTMVTDVDGHPVSMDLEAGESWGKRRSWRRKATKLEKEASAAWKKRREDGGYAPWVLIRGMIRGTEACVEPEGVRLQLQHATNDQAHLADDSDILPPTKTLREWADEYCDSKRLLKEFTFEKVVYGWNFGSLRQAMENTIRANYAHSTKPNISFDIEGSMISVRPCTWYSRMLSRPWVFFLLCITLIYPLFIWPFKRFARRGGGEWRAAGSAFALTTYNHLADSIPGESVDEYRQRTNTTLIDAGSSAEFKILKATPRGVAELVGQREGQWFAQWEDTIAGFVRQRYISSVPVSGPLGTFRTAGIGLDGYYPGV
ncbi:hypothetical protein FRB94_013111 [Tulasnella sp. JGI-2019a]|nr:hypothetical protein FRB94_013111 [Tulasnella sp. JGI-2019a]KAG9000762.1 hypothetical protein FRB93_012588 [Tulasnella sp. JGI-2019a]